MSSGSWSTRYLYCIKYWPLSSLKASGDSKKAREHTCCAELDHTLRGGAEAHRLRVHQGPQLSASLERWAADYSRDAPAAIAELLSFLVQASGLPGAKLGLDSVHGEAEDGLTDLLTDQTCAELVENAKQLARRAATANSTSPSPPHAFLLPPSHHTLPSTPLHPTAERRLPPLPSPPPARPPSAPATAGRFPRHARPLPQDAFIEPYPIADKKTGKSTARTC